MIEIAEMLQPTPSAVWKLARQAGIVHAVGGLPFNDPMLGTDAPWDFLPLQRMKQNYENGGFTLSVIEARPPLNLAKRGLEGRDKEIESVCTLLENMGTLGIPVWCYEWMTDFNWLRTSTTTPSRGGSVVTSFDQSLVKDASPTELGPI
ncbi:MAG TPA: mannonate dehydratase, partial [Roseiflexaceae bacterium]|nr:mannonate dehydratase [Roseiflexaceae bacterium]